MAGIIVEAVGATLVAGENVGDQVWFLVTGVALKSGLLGPVGNVQADRFGRRWLAGIVIVEIGYDVADAKRAPAVAVIGKAFVP